MFCAYSAVRVDAGHAFHSHKPSHTGTLYPMAAAQTTKANQARKAALKGTNGKKTTKYYSNTTFRLPSTLKLARKPKYPTKAVDHRPRLDDQKILISNVGSETAIAKIEAHNTLVLKVHMSANKHQIKKAVKNILGADALKVNTLVRPDGSKKAYVRLTADHDAVDVASRAGYL